MRTRLGTPGVGGDAAAVGGGGQVSRGPAARASLAAVSPVPSGLGTGGVVTGGRDSAVHLHACPTS